MIIIKELFDRLDSWRNLPNYQLERRADIFFALYLPEVLEWKFGYRIQKKIIPEFPVRIGTIYPHIKTNKSNKIDYIALSALADKAIFVELKTEGFSRRQKQDKYLLASQEVGLIRLLEGLIDIFRATQSKRKYFYLLLHLESMGLLHIPTQLKEIMGRPSLHGLNGVSHQIEVIANVRQSLIAYIQPNGEGPDTISFPEFANIVKKHEDPVSQRFADSLREWAEIQAGEKSFML
ncbi:MAG: hypothetical protein ACXACY_26140 [Candidatus Hodarchaeales archaeon]|jgi:hypothetical protein